MVEKNIHVYQSTCRYIHADNEIKFCHFISKYLKTYAVHSKLYSKAPITYHSRELNSIIFFLRLRIEFYLSQLYKKLHFDNLASQT